MAEISVSNLSKTDTPTYPEYITISAAPLLPERNGFLFKILEYERKVVIPISRCLSKDFNSFLFVHRKKT